MCASRGPRLPTSAEELSREAETSSLPGIRIGRALGALGQPALPELRQALRSASIPRQRVALYALGELGPKQPQLMAEILPFVTHGKTREVRLNALNALGKQGAYAAAAVPTIVRSVTDSDGGIRAEARRAALLENEPGVGYRELAAEAIGTLGEERVASAGTPEAKLAAIRALEMIYSRLAWTIVKRHWERSATTYPYDEARIKAIIGEPR